MPRGLSHRGSPSTDNLITLGARPSPLIVGRAPRIKMIGQTRFTRWALSMLLLLPAASCGSSGNNGTNPGGGCAAGQTLCGGVCVTTDSNPTSCGACGVTCGTGQACSGGACQ